MTYKSPTMLCGGARFDWGQRTYVMGIINVAPNSFSGDGVSDVDGAVAQGRRFVEEGAHILDVGASQRGPQPEQGSNRRCLELGPVWRQRPSHWRRSCAG